MKFKLLFIIFLLANAKANLCNDAYISHNVPKVIAKNIKNALKRQSKYLSSKQEQTVVNKIEQAIQPFGYFTPEIKLKFKNNSSCDQVNAHIKLGQATKITHILHNIEIPLSKLKIKTGQIFNVKNYNKSLYILYQHFKANGYRNVDLSQTHVTINPYSYSAIIDYRVNLGPKYYFGNIDFDSHHIDHSVVAKYLAIKQGETFSVLKLQKSQESLRESGFFNSVDIEILPAVNNIIPIKIKTVPADRIKMVFGIGYDNVDEIRAIFNAQMLVNSKGHIINNLSSVSRNNTILQLQYKIPANKPKNQKYIVQTSYIIDKNKNDKSINFSLSYSNKQQNFSKNVGINAINNKQGNTDSMNMVYPYINISEKNNQNKMKVQWSIDGIFAKRGLLSNLDVIQIRGQLYEKLILDEKFRLVVASQLGLNITNDPKKQPLPTLLTLGGNNGLRGYPLNSIINRDDNFQILRAISFELQRKITDNIYGTAFIDLGQVSHSFHEPWYRGIGIGAVYTTAIGDININLAKPLDKLPNLANRNLSLSISYSM